MTPAEIISRARKFSKATTSNVTDAQALLYLNTIKDEFWSEIVSRLDEDYNWQEWTGDTIIGQSEYTFPIKTAGSDALKTIKSVSIAYETKYYTGTTAIKYTKAKTVEGSTLDFDWDYYKYNQSTENPIFAIVDNSIKIAPVATAVVVAGLKLTGAREIEDYTLLSLESAVGIEKEHHQVLVLGLAETMAIDKGLPLDDVIALSNMYNNRKASAIKDMAARKEGPTTMLYIDQINPADPLIGTHGY